MNERIKQLAEQARVQDRGYFIYQYGGPTGHQSVEKAIDLEKFAELIVRECMDVLDPGENQLIARFQARQWLAEHFGVK